MRWRGDDETCELILLDVNGPRINRFRYGLVGVEINWLVVQPCDIALVVRTVVSFTPQEEQLTSRTTRMSPPTRIVQSLKRKNCHHKLRQEPSGFPKSAIAGQLGAAGSILNRRRSSWIP